MVRTGFEPRPRLLSLPSLASTVIVAAEAAPPVAAKTQTSAIAIASLLTRADSNGLDARCVNALKSGAPPAV